MNLLLIKDNTSSTNKGFVEFFFKFLIEEKLYKIQHLNKEKSQFDPSIKYLFIVEIPHSKLEKVWFNSLKLPGFISKYKIEKVFQSTLDFIVNEKTKVTFIVNDKNQIYSKQFLQIIQHTNYTSILTYHKNITTEIKEKYPEINVSYLEPIPEIITKDFSWEEQQTIKETYSNGEEYFLINGIETKTDDIVSTLKGFSILKKWQKSNIKLLVITDNVTEVQNVLSNYKFREDIALIAQPNYNALQEIIAAAYCTIQIFQLDSDLSFVYNSIFNKIPILLLNKSTAYAIVENKTFAMDELSVDTIGQALITMYKAENLRSDFIDDYTPITEKIKERKEIQINNFEL